MMAKPIRALELRYPKIQFLIKCIIGGQILITIDVIDVNLIDFVDDSVFQKIKVSNDFLLGWSSFVRRAKKSSSLFTWKYTRWGMLSIWICRSPEGYSENYINHCYEFVHVLFFWSCNVKVNLVDLNSSF